MVENLGPEVRIKQALDANVILESLERNSSQKQGNSFRSIGAIHIFHRNPCDQSHFLAFYRFKS